MMGPEKLKRSRIIADLGSSAEDDLAEVYNGPIISIRRLREAVRRRRLLVLGTAVLGLCVGAGFHLAVPTKVAAVSEIYLTEPSSVGQAGVANDISLLETTTVAERATHLLPSWARAESIGSYQALPVGSSILELHAVAGNPRAAVAWGTALENAFLEVRTAQLKGETSVLVDTLQAQASQFRTDIRRLNKEIYALEVPRASARVADEIGQLISQRGNDQSQVNQIAAQIEQDLLNQKVVLSGSSVLDPPVASTTSRKKVYAMDGLTGLVGGSAIGLGWLILSELVSERPRRRSDIAELLRVPVEMSLSGHRRLSIRSLRNRRGRHEPARRDPARLALRRLRRHLEASGGRLAVVPVGRSATKIGATWLAMIGRGLAARDAQVLMVDLTSTRVLARMLGARRPTTEPKAVRGGIDSLHVVVAGDDPGTLSPTVAMHAYDAVLVLSNLDPALGADHLQAWSTPAVVLVGAGEASETRLAATGQMLQDARVPARSAIVLGVGREDESFGTVTPDERIQGVIVEGGQDSSGDEVAVGLANNGHAVNMPAPWTHTQTYR